MVKPQKLLMVTGALSGGGAEQFFSTALAHLDREIFEPHLGLFDNDIRYDLPPDVPVAVFGSTERWKKAGTIRRLARWIDAHKPDVVAGSHWHPSMIIAEALRWTRTHPFHVCWVVSNPDKNPPPRTIPSFWINRNYPQIDRFVTVSEGVRNAFRRKFSFAPEKTELLYNPIDFTALDLRCQESMQPQMELDARRLILAAGRLEAVKRFDVLIDAFAQLPRTATMPLLVILGDGSRRADLDAQINRAGLREHVILPGFAENPYPWMTEACMLLSSSDYEGFGISLAEAQGLGIPVVSTDCDYGPSEIIEDNVTGLLVPTGDPAALAKAMQGLLADPQMAQSMGEAGRVRSRQMFGIDNLRDRLTDVLLPVSLPVATSISGEDQN